MNAEARSQDKLLTCLEAICGFFDLRFSADSAISGLPLVEGKLTPSLMQRACEQAGVEAKLEQIKFEALAEIDVPAIIILKNNDALVLTKSSELNKFDVLKSDDIHQPVTISKEELSRIYGGYVILTSPIVKLEERSQGMVDIEQPSWFWKVLYKNKRLYLHVMIAAFLTNLFVLVAPLFVMNVYDRVVPNQAMTTLWVLAIGAMIFFAFDMAARMLRHYLIDMAGRNADKELSATLFKQLIGLRMASKPSSAGTVAGYFSEFEALQEFFTSATFVSLIDIPFIFLYLLVVWIIGGVIVLIPLIAIPITIIAAYLLEIPSRQAIKNTLAGATFRQALLVEAVSGLESIKALNAEGIMQRHWENSVAKTTEAASISRFYSALTMNLTVWVQQVVVIAVVITGVYLIASGSLTVGGLIACTILAGRAMMLGQVSGLLNRLERSRAALRGLNRIMTMPTDRGVRDSFLQRPTLKGNVSFENVTFYYPNERIAALDKINFQIKEGERIGIVGKIGAGKSTLLKLINGLYAPTQGIIRIDGSDNTEIDPADLRRNVHYVSDDSVLFYGTIRDNIAMGNPRASDDEILRAAQLAGVDKIVQIHPSGYDMPVGERGQLLSSGQRTAVALARALIANPSVLMLDEPTGSVDNGFEQDFMKALPPYLKGKTLIVVTHRASVLDLVDRVLVIDGGRLVADGPKALILDKLLKPETKPEK
ncbi:MAG: type I secretion system permease/ATPase [Gammaproteobacteria bacterium]|nr:type I secretion system permease/ATPase [Gammaproteobacteria bacterium]